MEIFCQVSALSAVLRLIQTNHTFQRISVRYYRLPAGNNRFYTSGLDCLFGARIQDKHLAEDDYSNHLPDAMLSS